ncbi:hypothetical protein D3C83_195900 [compost metagenome]
MVGFAHREARPIVADSGAGGSLVELLHGRIPPTFFTGEAPLAGDFASWGGGSAATPVLLPNSDISD